MNKKKFIKLLLFSILVLLFFVEVSAGRENPYRVLVIIGDQWDDPGSYNIDETRVSGSEFRDVITMLKIWGIPFDILRLDQQNLQINRFLNGIAEPNYRCTIWMADPDKIEGAHANYETLRRAVEEYGMSLIALFDYVKAPEISNLVGIEYENYMITSMWFPENRFKIVKEHFITAGTVGMELPEGVNVLTEKMARHRNYNFWTVHCKAKDDGEVLATLGGSPQIVVQEFQDDVKTVWIGGQHNWFQSMPITRQFFRRALVWCMGYGLFNDNFENALTMVMDDMGASEHAYSMGWHYPTPSKELIIKYLVEPLEEYNGLMVQNVTPGYANPKTRMVESPWKVEKFIDPFGQIQDYPSTKEGLDEGLHRGIFEIQSHRAWTHMNWDLESPPGPWWDAPLKGEMAHPRWWQETIDARRSKSVPSNDMLFIYKVGRDAIERQFGVTPLSVTCRPGRDLYHDNGRLAAIAGYGISWSRTYIGYDYTIQFSMMTPEHFGCHDLDLAKAPELPRRWIEANKDKRWMGFNEVCAYVHSGVDAKAQNGLTILFNYDDYYCRYFGDNLSTWTLELSERFQKKLGKKVSMIIDGKETRVTLNEKRTIEIPAGVGIHKVEIKR